MTIEKQFRQNARVAYEGSGVINFALKVKHGVRNMFVICNMFERFAIISK